MRSCLRRFVVPWLGAVCLVAVAAAPAFAQGSGGAAAPLLKLFESGRLPADKQPTVLKMICDRGDAADLARVLAWVVEPGKLAPELRLESLAWLADAAATRKVRPAGDLTLVEKLLEPGAGGGDPRLQLAVIRLVALWKLEDMAAQLQALAVDESTDEELQQAAIEGLIALGGAESRATVERLAASADRVRIRFLAVAALVRSNLDRAAELGADALAAATPDDDPAPLVDAFLVRKGGADRLAAALATRKLTPDVAKLALRYMYSVGRSDAELSAVLSHQGGVAADPPPPTPEEVQQLVAQVTTSGDPVRGEQIFRRADLSCMKCHSLNRAGGSVGPELTAVGSISPVDYIVNSILQPNLAIKEQYVTRIVQTVDGEIITGIVIDRDNVRLNLRDATGKHITVPVADIDDEAEGKSLMPQGITKFLTRDELIDLVAFVSSLGKPGPYAIRATPAIQRWRWLRKPAAELTADVPNVELLRQFVLAAPPSAWTPCYGMASGALPLGELCRPGQPAVLYLQGELQVSQGGPIEFHVACPEPTQVWINAEPFEGQATFTTNLPPGRHTVTVRVASTGAEGATLLVEPRKPAGSTVQFDVVGGT